MDSVQRLYSSIFSLSSTCLSGSFSARLYIYTSSSACFTFLSMFLLDRLISDPPNYHDADQNPNGTLPIAQSSSRR
jgi:hypothetical protein